MLHFFFLFLILIPFQALCQNADTLQPVWVTSKFFRAGNEAVIKELTGSNVKPTYTFTFSSSFIEIPNLGYGIKNYEGKHIDNARK